MTPCPTSLEAGCEASCLVISEINTISGGVGDAGSGGTEAEGTGVIRSGVVAAEDVVGEGATGVEGEGGNDIIIATRDENHSLSQAHISSRESFWKHVAPDSHELKRMSNLIREATALGLQNCFSGQFLTMTPCFCVMRSSKRSYCMRRLVVPVIAPTNGESV